MPFKRLLHCCVMGKCAEMRAKGYNWSVGLTVKSLFMLFDIAFVDLVTTHIFQDRRSSLSDHQVHLQLAVVHPSNAPDLLLVVQLTSQKALVAVRIDSEHLVLLFVVQLLELRHLLVHRHRGARGLLAVRQQGYPVVPIGHNHLLHQRRALCRTRLVQPQSDIVIQRTRVLDEAQQLQRVAHA